MSVEETGTEPLDATDEAILRELREVAARVDPCPRGLVERITFALTVQALQAEVAELTSQPALVARSATTQEPTEATTVMWSTDALTIMVTVTREGPGRARVDGWLTCGRAEVELDLGPGPEPRRTTADEDGRFALPDLPRTLVHLLVRPADGRPVVTPQFGL